MARATLPGDWVVCWTQYAVNALITVSMTDDKADSFTLDHKGIAGDLNQTVVIMHVAATTGASMVTIAFSGAAATFYQSGCAEFNNINALDVCGEHTGSGTAMTAGSFTPTITGDLVISIFEQESGVGGTSWTVGTNANITWALMQSDIGYGAGQTASQMAMWGVYNSTAALNPAATQAPTNTFGGVSCSYKSAASGSAPPTSIYTTAVQHYNVKTTGTSFALPAPLTGNLGVLHCITAPVSGPITAVSGSVSGVWVHIGDVPNNSGSGILMDWYKPNATLAPNDVLTVTATAGLNVADCHLYSVANALAAPLDTAASAGAGTTCTSGFCTATGTQSVGGNLSTVVITPSTANGIIIAHAGVNSQGLTGTAGQAYNDMSWSPQEAGQNDLDENNGKGSFSYTTPVSTTFTYTESALIGTWAASGEVFLGAGGGGGGGGTGTGNILLKGVSP